MQVTAHIIIHDVIITFELNRFSQIDTKQSAEIQVNCNKFSWGFHLHLLAFSLQFNLPTTFFHISIVTTY